MQQLQMPTRPSSVQIFSECKEFDTSSGSKLYRLTNSHNRDVCRVDERFIPLIERELERIELGEEVEFICIPDRHNENGWRLDLEYYRSDARNQTSYSPPFSSKYQTAENICDQTKKVTFVLAKQDHTFISNLYKRLKHTNSMFGTFADFTAYIFTTSIRDLRLHYPDLDKNIDSFPF